MEGQRAPSLGYKPQQLYPLMQRVHMPQAWGAAPTSPGYGLWLWRPADLGHNEGVFALTAGEHDMVAGVAQVGVRLAQLALGPHAESQATAVTALLGRETLSLPTPGPSEPTILPHGPVSGVIIQGTQEAAQRQAQGIG